MRVTVVGAGMAGLAAATQLARDGAAVTLFDKARGVGGRMSVRRLDANGALTTFDHGAQYFTARDPGFVDQVGRWHDQGVVAPWPVAGGDAWVGMPAMNAPLKTLAAGLDVRWRACVHAIARDGAEWIAAVGNGDRIASDCLVVAIPAERAAMVLENVSPIMAATAKATRSAPCWTVLAAFDGPIICDDIIRHADAIGWASRNSAKPGRTGPERWVLQATPEWSRANLEEAPERVVAALLAAFAQAVGQALPRVVASAAHRWRYARSGSAEAACLWDAGARLGVCGDWLLGPRVEAAWQSGTALATAMRS